MEQQPLIDKKKEFKKESLNNIDIGNRVVPSQNWTWGNQNDGHLGTVIASPNNGDFLKKFYKNTKV